MARGRVTLISQLAPRGSLVRRFCSIRQDEFISNSFTASTKIVGAFGLKQLCLTCSKLSSWVKPEEKKNN